MSDRLILLSNDDGYFREEIRALFHRLKDLGRVHIVAPDREKSATSLALTLRHPLRVQKIRPRVHAVDGTPADCIFVALQKILPRPPDLVISGLNPGPNLGQQDVHYSGTVAAAVQGTFLGIPSMAVSMIPRPAGSFDLDFAVRVVRDLAVHILSRGLPKGVTLNVNIPPPPVKGAKITKLGLKFYSPEIIERKDPRGASYYWIGTGNPRRLGDAASDVQAAYRGYISITPLHADRTHYRALKGPALKAVAKAPRLSRAGDL
ncbi:MAG: 5'/3'-nucleotidase SurE [Candidatus Aminicenantes bacterium]|nr:5'/3'-nucleotidase SurE [Candidatus Aminicenantes bacterium]